MLEGLLELVSPTKCAGCDLPGQLLCDACARMVERVHPETACARCGAPEGAVRCGECAQSTFRFSAARCAGVLAHPLSRAIVLFKDAGERRLAGVLGALLVDGLDGWLDWPDAVVAVPASRLAVTRRGFDHGALLAAAVGDRGGWPVVDALSCATRGDQRRLDRQARAANVTAALSLKRDVRVPPRILVVDDVLTTGATLDAAAAALLGGGAREVRVAAVARACGA